jgi:phosphopantothenoylcysteine synthetase/decarboxylase
MTTLARFQIHPRLIEAAAQAVAMLEPSRTQGAIKRAGDEYAKILAKRRPDLDAMTVEYNGLLFAEEVCRRAQQILLTAPAAPIGRA